MICRLCGKWTFGDHTNCPKCGYGRKTLLKRLLGKLTKKHKDIYYEVTNNILTLTLEKALSDGGLWSDGTFLWFRQLRLCPLKLYREGDPERLRVGEAYDITLKPVTLKGWTVARETKNCYAIEKTSYFKCAKGKPYHHNTYLPKKSILRATRLPQEITCVEQKDDQGRVTGHAWEKVRK